MSDFVNPLTFSEPSNLINLGQNGVNPGTRPTDDDAKKQFLQLLLQKVYLKDFGLSGASQMDESADDNSDFSINTSVSNSIVNEMFRQQLASQIIDSDQISLGNISVNGVK